MALLNTTKSALFLKSGAVLPVAPANFIENTVPIMITPEIAVTDYNRISGKLNTSDSYADTCNSQVNFAVEHLMRSNDIGATTLDAVPEYGELLKICGFDETISAGVSVGYINTQVPVLGSAVVVLDGNQFEMTGSMASDMTLDLTIGSPAKLSCSLQGYIDDAVPTVVTQPDPTLSDEPLMVVSCANLVTLGGTVLKPDSVKFMTNPEIADFYTMGGTDGLKSKAMTDYGLTCEISFFIDNADYAREVTAIKNQTYATLEVLVATDDASALVNGKSMKITCGLVKTTTYTDTDQDNVGKRTVTYRVSNDSNDHALSILVGTFA